MRRTTPGEVDGLHQAATRWFAAHGFPVEAVRHAQAAQDWSLASRLLAGHWPGLQLGGQAAAVHELLAGFSADAAATDAELAVLIAADELAQGSLEAAERYLGVAARGAAAVPAGRREQLQVLLKMVRLLLARQRGDPAAVAEEARRLRAVAEAPDAALPGLGEELRGLAVISLGIAEVWAGRAGRPSRPAAAGERGRGARPRRGGHMTPDLDRRLIRAGTGPDMAGPGAARAARDLASWCLLTVVVVEVRVRVTAPAKF